MAHQPRRHRPRDRRPLADIITEADTLAAELEQTGGRVYRTAIRGAAAKLTNEAAAAVRERLGLPAARYAVAVGNDERTWPQFHSRDAALRCAAGYGLTADAVRDGAPAPAEPERCTPIAGGKVHEVSSYKGPDGEEGTFSRCAAPDPWTAGAPSTARRPTRSAAGPAWRTSAGASSPAPARPPDGPRFRSVVPPAGEADASPLVIRCGASGR